MCVPQIDLATFLTMTDQDLRELGITTFGARRKMLLAIAGNILYTSFYSAVKVSVELKGITTIFFFHFLFLFLE